MIPPMAFACPHCGAPGQVVNGTAEYSCSCRTEKKGEADWFLERETKLQEICTLRSYLHEVMLLVPFQSDESGTELFNRGRKVLQDTAGIILPPREFPPRHLAILALQTTWLRPYVRDLLIRIRDY